jgi:hypothetical protein
LAPSFADAPFAAIADAPGEAIAIAEAPPPGAVLLSVVVVLEDVWLPFEHAANVNTSANPTSPTLLMEFIPQLLFTRIRTIIVFAFESTTRRGS